MNKRQLIEDIKYLRETVLEYEYLVNEDWLVNRGFEDLVSGNKTLNEFLVDTIKDIFSEVEVDTYGSFLEETVEKFRSDKRVQRIAKRYNISFDFE